MVIIFSGAVGNVKSRALRNGEATSIRHCVDGEEISQGKETDTRIPAQVLYVPVLVLES